MSDPTSQVQHLQELNWFVLDAAENEAAYGLIGREGNFIKLSPSAYALLRLANAGYSFAAIAEAMSRRQRREVSACEVEAAYRHVAGQITSIEQSAPRTFPGFWLRVTCLPASFVNRIAPYLALAFHPPGATCLVAVVLAIIGTIAAREPIVQIEATAAASILFILSMFIHELGHAAACYRYGARPREIGFTLYWIYPALYNDVSTAWQLKRWQRVVVDLGGVYFHLVAGAVYGAIYLLTGWLPLRQAFVLVLFSVLFSLNPILKFDGYWVVADALGVTDLSGQVRRLLSHFWGRLRQHPIKPLPWSVPMVVALALYGLGSFGLWGYFLARAAPALWHNLVTYPQAVASFVEIGSWRGGLAFLNASVAALVSVVILQGLGRWLFGQARGLWRGWHD